MVRIKRILIVLFIFPIVGFVVGIALLKWDLSKEWSKWDSLGTPPSKAIEVVSACPLIVLASDGNNYTHIINRWEITEETQPCKETEWDQIACEGVESPPIDNIVNSEVSCFAWGKAAAGYSYHEFALLEDGSIWEWSKSYSADDGMLIVMWPTFGIAIFGAIAIIIVLIFLFDDLLVSLKEKANANDN